MSGGGGKSELSWERGEFDSEWKVIWFGRSRKKRSLLCFEERRAITESTFSFKASSWLPACLPGTGSWWILPKIYKSGVLLCCTYLKRSKEERRKVISRKIAPFSSSTSHHGRHVSAVVLCTMSRVKISQFSGWFHIHSHEYSSICFEKKFGVSFLRLLRVLVE